VADEPGRHAVLAVAHHHLRAPVDARGEGERGVERLGWQRPQQRSFEGPVVSDAARAVADAPPVVGVIPGLESAFSSSTDPTVGIGTQWLQRNRPPCLHAALLVTALMTGLAVKRVKAGLPGVQQF